MPGGPSCKCVGDRPRPCDVSRHEQEPAVPDRPRIQAIVDAPPPPKEAVAAGNKHRISDKLRRALELLASGKCKEITAAAEQAAISRENLGRALDKPHVIDYVRTRAQRRLAILAGRAAEVKGELLDSENDLVRDRASTHILGTAGIGPATAPSLNFNIEIKAGYVIDLTDEPRPAPRVINP